MRALSSRCEALLDQFAGELTDAAYPVALERGVQGSSVDVEVEVGHAIAEVLRRERRRLKVGHDTAGRALNDDVLARVTEAVYQVALRHGFPGSFLALELDLWEALSEAGRSSPRAASLSCRPAAALA